MEDVAVKLESWVAAVTATSCQQCHGPLFCAEARGAHSHTHLSADGIHTGSMSASCKMFGPVQIHTIRWPWNTNCPLQCKQASVAVETAWERAAPADVAVLAAVNAAAAGAVVLASAVA